jgi:hypothetical protein
MLKRAIKSDMRLIESLCGKARRYSRREKSFMRAQVCQGFLLALVEEDKPIVQLI